MLHRTRLVFGAIALAIGSTAAPSAVGASAPRESQPNAVTVTWHTESTPSPGTRRADRRCELPEQHALLRRRRLVRFPGRPPICGLMERLGMVDRQHTRARR